MLQRGKQQHTVIKQTRGPSSG